MNDTTFVYVTYIRTTPEKLWQALTTREFLSQYWSGGPAGVDPQPGSPVKWEIGGEARDLGQVVLESEPYRRLSCSWHTYQRKYAEMFGWTMDAEVFPAACCGTDNSKKRRPAWRTSSFSMAEPSAAGVSASAVRRTSRHTRQPSSPTRMTLGMLRSGGVRAALFRVHRNSEGLTADGGWRSRLACS